MPYQLKYDDAARAVRDALPGPVRARLMVLLDGVREDPIGTTVQHGEDDGGVMRMLVTNDVMALLLIGQTFKTVTVLQIIYLG